MSKLEFLLNYGGSDTGEFLARRKARDGRYGFLSEDFLPGNFLEYFDYQWMITDFNVSVMFDPMSTPEDRLVVGLCGGKVLCDLDSYPKVSIDVLGRVHTLIVFQYYSTGPEVWKEPNIGRPYCPFKHDVWQLSTLLENLYPVSKVC